MHCNLRKRLSYANVMASLGVFLALGGVGYAAANVNSATIVNNSIRGKDVHQRTLKSGDIRKNSLGGDVIKESKLAAVPEAENASTLGGMAPGEFEKAGNLVRYGFTLAPGATREIVSHGPLKLTARCIDNGTDQNMNAGRDVARIFATTSQDGSFLSGDDILDGGPVVTDFLTTATVEEDAIWDENSVPNGDVDATAGGDDDVSMVAAPDGSVISGLSEGGLLLGVNVLGSACAYEGWLVLS